MPDRLRPQSCRSKNWLATTGWPHLVIEISGCSLVKSVAKREAAAPKQICCDFCDSPVCMKEVNLCANPWNLWKVQFKLETETSRLQTVWGSAFSPGDSWLQVYACVTWALTAAKLLKCILFGSAVWYGLRGMLVLWSTCKMVCILTLGALSMTKAATQWGTVC